jgi:hypothetical protein
VPNMLEDASTVRGLSVDSVACPTKASFDDAVPVVGRALARLSKTGGRC